MKQNWILYLLIIIAFSLRLAYIDRPMRFDESQTVVLYAINSIPSIMADYNAPNNHIFHTLFVHFTFNYLGETPIFVRLPALISGILLIPLTYVIGTRFYNKRVGLIAATLITVSPIMIEFSINARGYSLQIVIMMLMLLLGYELQNKDHTGRWLLFSVLAALGFLTIPTMLYIMGGIALWLIVSIVWYNTGEQRILLLKNYTVSIILGAVLTLLSYALVIIFSGLDSLISNVNILPQPPSEYYAQFGNVISMMLKNLIWSVPPLIAIPISTLAIIGFLFHQRVAHQTLNILFFFVAWVIPVLLIQRVTPFVRVWTFLVPIFALYIGIGLDVSLRGIKQWRPFIIMTCLGLLVSGMIVHISQNRIITNSSFTANVPDSEKAAFAFDDLLTPDDELVLQVPNTYSVFYYGLIYDMPFAEWALGLRDNIGEPSGDTGYIYVFYHRGMSDETLLIESLNEAVPGGLATVEILYDWEHSELGRVPIPSD